MIQYFVRQVFLSWHYKLSCFQSYEHFYLLSYSLYEAGFSFYISPSYGVSCDLSIEVSHILVIVDIIGDRINIVMQPWRLVLSILLREV